MSNRDHATGKQSERDEALLAVIEAVVKERNCRALEHLFNADEINPMLS
jgi:hypothetical protein